MRSVLSFACCLLVAGCTSMHDGVVPEDKPGSESEPDRPWSDTIRPDVLAVMRRQEAMQPAVQVLYEQYVRAPNSGFAGLAFEGDGLTLYYKGDLTTEMSAALATASRVAPVVVKAAAFSAAELKADGAEIDAAVKSRGVSDIQRVSFSYDGSGLEVERMPATEAARIAALRNRAGKTPLWSAEQIIGGLALRAPVKITVGTSLNKFNSSRTADSSPWNGGDLWTNWRHGTDRGGSCTTGFGVNASGRTWILTAAHCASLGDVAYQDQVRLGPVNSDQWRYDLLLLDTPGWYLIFDGTPTTTTTKHVLDWGYWATNELVCQSGATSGTVCNLKTLTNGNYTSTLPDSDGDSGYTVYDLVAAQQMDGAPGARPGDSGGPVFTLDGAGVRAKGVVSGTQSANNTVLTFPHWGTVTMLFGAYPRVN